MRGGGTNERKNARITWLGGYIHVFCKTKFLKIKKKLSLDYPLLAITFNYYIYTLIYMIK